MRPPWSEAVTSTRTADPDRLPPLLPSGSLNSPLLGQHHRLQHPFSCQRRPCPLASTIIKNMHRITSPISLSLVFIWPIPIKWALCPAGCIFHLRMMILKHPDLTPTIFVGIRLRRVSDTCWRTSICNRTPSYDRNVVEFLTHFSLIHFAQWLGVSSPIDSPEF